MKFSIFVPPGQNLPVLYFLPGRMTTNEKIAENVDMFKMLELHKIACVIVDSSPRDLPLPYKQPEWILKVGNMVGYSASYYIDIPTEPWCKHFNMHTYVYHELPKLISLMYP
jgi:S-formylglutathione hydrolase